MTGDPVAYHKSGTMLTHFEETRDLHRLNVVKEALLAQIPEDYWREQGEALDSRELHKSLPAIACMYGFVRLVPTVCWEAMESSAFTASKIFVPLLNKGEFGTLPVSLLKHLDFAELAREDEHLFRISCPDYPDKGIFSKTRFLFELIRTDSNWRAVMHSEIWDGRWGDFCAFRREVKAYIAADGIYAQYKGVTPPSLKQRRLEDLARLTEDVARRKAMVAQGKKSRVIVGI